MRDYKNYQIKIQDRTEISRYSHSFPGKYIKSKTSGEGGQLNGARRTKKSTGPTMGTKETLIKPLSSDWNPPELCILSSSCKSEQRQNSRPENEFKRSWSVNAPIFKSICIIIPAFTSLNKFSNISGMYFKNTQHTYEKEARETIHERN